MTVPSKVLDDLFSQKLERGESEPIEGFDGDYVAERLAEDASAASVIPPQKVEDAPEEEE